MGWRGRLREVVGFILMLLKKPPLLHLLPYQCPSPLCHVPHHRPAVRLACLACLVVVVAVVVAFVFGFDRATSVEVREVALFSPGSWSPQKHMLLEARRGAEIQSAQAKAKAGRRPATPRRATPN